MTAAGVPVQSELVDSWERGVYSPSEPQLFALADALWCSPVELMGIEPRTLREHRLARQLTQERLAEHLGMSVADYAKAESEERWLAPSRQTNALALALGLSIRQLVTSFGEADKLNKHLRGCIKGRWKGHVGAISEITAIPKTRIAEALRTIHEDHKDFSERYMGHLVTRNDDVRLKELAAERATFVNRLWDYFWELVGEAGPAEPAASPNAAPAPPVVQGQPPAYPSQQGYPGYPNQAAAHQQPLDYPYRPHYPQPYQQPYPAAPGHPQPQSQPQPQSRPQAPPQPQSQPQAQPQAPHQPLPQRQPRYQQPQSRPQGEPPRRQPQQPYQPPGYRPGAQPQAPRQEEAAQEPREDAEPLRTADDSEQVPPGYGPPDYPADIRADLAGHSRARFPR